ncbi:MAG: glycosyltransferase [Scytolyngbya sp. HA4215-MV1]|jgi:glycosyltransferase involved in cell wall biosynthesis|nr:glycosyltransferase [Scytolyngbya sp. HA4215-MV1]
MPSVSIVVPAYNAERTILETIRSIQAQTFSDFELIVINDGSTDQTLQRLDTVEDTRLKVFSYENGGLPVARNRGIQRSTGEFISFIDADDLWTPDKLELQLKALQEHPDAGVAYSWTAFIDEQSTVFHYNDPIWYEGNVYHDLLLKCFIANGSNILVRQECVKAVGEFDPSLRSTEDWEYYLRLASQYPFVLVPKHQILYRRSASSMTSKVTVMEKYNLLVAERAFQSAPQEFQYLKNQSLSNIYIFITKICLEHECNKDGVKQARSKLAKAIQLYPKALLDQKNQYLLLKLVLLSLLSYKTVRYMADMFRKGVSVIRAN